MLQLALNWEAWWEVRRVDFTINVILLLAFGVIGLVLYLLVRIREKRHGKKD